jgi:NAD-dependent SIR2 family protein deacetylase
MKAQCRKCGKWFPISKEQIELMEEGFISGIDINLCDECADILNDAYDYSYEQYSDADNGL